MPRQTVPSEQPEGLIYQPDFVSAAEERALIAGIDDIRFDEVVFRGQVARRRVKHFGYGYDFETRVVEPTTPIPEFMLPLRARCAELAERDADRLVEALVTVYPPGATIGWHRDAPMFGSRVVGVSLAAACRMRFQRGSGDARRVYELRLEPRSAYVLGGAARASWQHSIPPVAETRYSITFRTLRARR